MSVGAALRQQQSQADAKLARMKQRATRGSSRHS